MTLGLLAALLTPLLAAPAYDLDLNERTEVRVRSPGDGIDFEQAGTALLSMRARRLTLSLEYTPELTFTDLLHEPSIDLLHTGVASSEVEFRRLKLTLTERAAYGTRSFTSLAPNTYDLVLNQNGMQIIPIAASVQYVLSETTLLSEVTLSARSSVGFTAGYRIEGGLDDRARRVIPYIYGPRVQGSYSYQVAARDELTTTVDGTTVHTDTGSFGPKLRSDVVRGIELWAHSLSPRTTSELAGGAAWARRDPSPVDPELFLIGFGSLRHVFPGSGRERSDVLGRVQVDSQVDRLTGRPDYRLSVQMEANWMKDPFALYGQLGRAQSLQQNSPTNALTLYSGELGLRYQWLDPLLVEVGYRAAYQDVDLPTTTAAAVARSGFNWMAYAALQVTAERIHF